MGRRPQIKRFKAVERFQPSRSCAPRQHFPSFLSLPMELRCQVYESLLHSPNAIDVAGLWYQKPALTLSLLRVSKFVSVEAAHYFYSVNTFVLLEDCDAHQKDYCDIIKSPAYQWLQAMKTYAPSLRNIHLRIRIERPMGYYTHLLSFLATLAPNISRLAIVGERHKVIDRRRENSSVFRWYYEWHPNRVMPLKGGQIEMLGQVLRKFENLRLVVLGGRQESAAMNALCELLRKCRVQGIKDEASGRESFLVRGMLWPLDGTCEEVKWYDAVYGPGDDGRDWVVKQFVKDMKEDDNEEKGDN
ncbi:hypothetical protein C8A03DRAFT_33874 [Achaetomium macrosporum]|uniref:F-box domain-containing protein n=1 Tax=Achaetomium macrosporum TaxID=79813 RepID=A0AAN7HFD2_9PEZI|nr:hypothetical protein C8A03DRAFT_33874 [Achaetomium macrosporum]